MKFLKKTFLYVLILALLGTQTALADTVELSDSPILGQTSAAASADKTATAQEAGTRTVTTQAAAAENTASAGPGQTAASAQSSAAGVSAGGTSVNQVVLDSKITKPELYSQAAALYDATTGQFLYTKNGDQAMYPASTTKIMTVLLAAEKLSLGDVVNFSASATENLESGYTNVSMVKGDTMTAKDAMYAILLKSACEVSNAVAEQISGTQAQFAELMNSRAKALGCTNTNFRNASGLNDASHYTSAHDMALIAAAAFANQTFRAVASSKSYTLPASKKRSSLQITNSNKMLYSSNAEYMEGIVGGKTGYTSKAGNTLVEVLDTDGHELVAVVLKSNGKQYTDAKALFNYGKKLIAGSGVEQAAEEGTWETTSSGKKYKFANGKYAASEWVDIGDSEYYFGSDGIMATGWKQFTNGAWYYFDKETGAMVHDKWVSTDGEKYYYLQSNGVMATNTVINGTYRVDANGIYVEKVG